ncbi:hypothetical protein AUEXF2481DRAFT_579126 [Aureobasidium subglaciale EXF-2481]|uniref:Zn(2)-C6 fungal-type domain-containing protein n=1 Tax=Aureobasidium subglaciale (strain EXF-2481) TaxID=1043005 RepID=A0A074XXM8_AURSE|nr:uncharacterized protein AUEXF2481DRAFT_579126 [Aureobasidium subglaciale EXF-2481]KAI5194180.1 hypothetical protein E4T38_09675 [Aureobasidium subglaciale]KAI5213600.1 hypothetical protein E4T40_09617 [Aureobasidium subglaciale]KAI5215274.1 hypothetical protein E4T41_09655 [Aureobasidium subglaciale]KAI5253254.1 hypothetical protein E4T46_09632 [Aureobasidium subglaciale]KEQ90225.1 hypothetical protein AUEXF2481DRAFT_579126 [Aureobasidium subglaciale EXF-2481]
MTDAAVAAYEAVLRQDRQSLIEDDVRRFACDRCRGQKLRCERLRASLEEPLRSAPCRRCLKARAECTTSTQPPRIDRSQHRTRRGRPARARVGSRADTDDGSHDGDESDDDAENEVEMRDYEEPRLLTPARSSNGSAPHKPSTVSSGNPDTTVVSRTFVQMPMALGPPSKIGSPDDTTMDTSQPPGLAGVDAGYFDPVHLLFDQNYMDSDWADILAPNNSGFNFDIQRSSDHGSSLAGRPGQHGQAHSHGNSAAQDVSHDETSVTFPEEPTSPRSAPAVQRPGIDLSTRLTELISSIFNDILSEPVERQGTARNSRDSCQISRLIGKLEQYTTLLSEVSSSARPRQITNATSQTGPSSSRRQPCEFAQSSLGSTSTGCPGLPALMTMVAAYSTILQAYERVFDGIKEVLVQKSQTKSSLTALLPLFQLDNLKCSGHFDLRVHISMEVLLHMLNQIEAQLHLIITTLETFPEATRSSLANLVRSMAYNEGEQTVSVSASVREKMNHVRKLFVAKNGTF